MPYEQPSEDQLAIINVTAGLVGGAVDVITSTFYSKLFASYGDPADRDPANEAIAGNPNLWNVFNRTNQATGKQQKSLSGAIIAYVTHLGNLGAITPEVMRIANKHCALGVQEAHYGVVYTVLMEAIAEVLGTVDTKVVGDLIAQCPEGTDVAAVLGAWGQAVLYLAGIFVKTETELYNSSTWTGTKEFKVVGNDAISPDGNTKHITLAPVDGKLHPAVPGQYLTLHKYVDGKRVEGLAPRHYTISASDNLSYQVTVRRHQDGPLSEYITDLAVGDTIHSTVPYGTKTIDWSTMQSSQVVFISIGSGFSVTESVAVEALKQGREIAIVHADRNASSLPTNPALTQFVIKNFFRESKENMTIEAIMDAFTDAPQPDAFYVLCCGNGTKALVDGLTALGISAANIQTHFFIPYDLRG
jgi:nitric oxide dioxygenase